MTTRRRTRSRKSTTNPDRSGVRLNRFLAQVGVDSRRNCDEIIASGKVKIDGKLVKTPGARVLPGVSRVTVNGVEIGRPARPIVLLLHKPTGVVSTVSDPEGRPTVVDFCKSFARRKRLFPVGRLDVNTTGALLITNDGMLCYHLTHPRFQIPKTYLVRARGGFNERTLGRMAKYSAVGSHDPGLTKPIVLVKQMDKVVVLRITLREGRNRQVRKMCEAVGLHVVKLKRETFGAISIRKLPLGSVRPLDEKELSQLHAMVESGMKR